MQAERYSIETAILTLIVFRGRLFFLEQKISKLRVKQFDGFAVATLVLHDNFRVSEQIVEGSYRSLCVFNAAKGGWQWAAGQTTAHKTEA